MHIKMVLRNAHLLDRYCDFFARHRIGAEGSIPMLDVILLALGLGFFVLTVGYAYACDRL